MGKNKSIQVLVIDDALVSREIIATGIEKDPFIQVIGKAADVFEAREKIIAHLPDVLTLDIHMPKMDGISFLKKLMAQYPLPVVVISGSEKRVFEALEAGAVDFVVKPQIEKQEQLEQFLNEVIHKIKIASVAKIQNTKSVQSDTQANHIKGLATHTKMIAIGASTGGTDAILKVVKQLPADMPGIVVVQHMPAVFTEMYAKRLNALCKLTVKEAQEGDRVESGVVLIAPGEHHMKVYKDKSSYFVKCFKGQKVNGHAPSVDVLFDSVAEAARHQAVGIILTGMGSDGAKGLMKMRKARAYTLGQDQKTSVVYGMPMVAYNIGAVQKQVGIDEIAKEIVKYIASH